MAAPRKYTDEQYAQMRDMINDGATVREASETVGVPVQSWYRHLKKPDPVPGRRRRTKREEKQSVVTDDELKDTFGMIMSAPSMIMLIPRINCVYCATHFATRGPDAANKLVELSQENTHLRKMLVVVHTYLTELAWAGVLGVYLGVPIMHHLAPRQVYDPVAPFLKMPARGNANHRDPGHVHANAPGAPAQPGGNPFEHLDTDALMAMAASMGMQVAPDMMGANGNEPATTDDRAPAPSEGATSADTPPESGDASAATSDPDAGKLEP